MVVKASTKPWPRQLGSSIIRALPPLSQAGRGGSQVEFDFPVAFWIRSVTKASKLRPEYIMSKKARVASEQDETNVVEHAGLAVAAVVVRTSAAPPRAARAAIAPPDDVRHVIVRSAVLVAARREAPRARARGRVDGPVLLNIIEKRSRKNSMQCGE